MIKTSTHPGDNTHLSHGTAWDRSGKQIWHFLARKAASPMLLKLTQVSWDDGWLPRTSIGF